MEIWKNIKEYPNYAVSNQGRVINIKTKKILKPNKKKNGYLEYRLYKSGKIYYLLAHRLVAIAFIENKRKVPFINHKNEIKTDNRVENLEWCTHKENCNYGTAIYRRVIHTDFKKRNKNINFIKGTKKGKRVYQYDLKGNCVQVYNTCKEAAIKNNINITNICNCAKGIQKTAGNYIWSYERRNDLLVSQY